MDRRIHFGTIGLIIGDEITFMDGTEIFLVASGNGTPENGGTLISYKDHNETGNFSLRFISRRLMRTEFNDQVDIWSCWKHKGRTLRSIFDEKSGFFTEDCQHF